MYRIQLGAISVRVLAMSLSNVSTTRLVLDAQRLDTRMIHVLKNTNVLTVEKKHSWYNKKLIFFKREYDIQHVKSIA